MRFLKWLWSRITHKLDHLRWSNIKALFKKHGMALVIIFLLWEIIEDVAFPMLFIWLGNNVNPWFLSGAPISWLLCVHPIAVPILWGFWLWISKTDTTEAEKYLEKLKHHHHV